MATAVDSVAPREEPSVNARLSLSEAWHLLSLDAPTVAALWSWIFARAMRVHLPWHAPLILALGTWLIYVADRLLDGHHHPSPARPLRRRHLFHARHRTAFLATATVAGLALVWLIVTRMSANTRLEDTVLFLVAMLYFFLVHKPNPDAASWLPKELAVGVVFAAATAVPAWSRLDGPGRIALLPAVTIFALLCWLNCVAIEKWEAFSTSGGISPSAAHSTTLWMADHFGAVAFALSVISVGFAVGLVVATPFLTSEALASIYIASSLAALGLVVIDRQAPHLCSLRSRIAADVALLTPLIFLSLPR